MPTVNTGLRFNWVGGRSAVLLIAISVYLCFGSSLLAQTFDGRTTGESNQSWTATSEEESTNLRPIRIAQSHSQNGNRTLDKRSVDILTYDGHFESCQEIETETVQVDAGTVRTTTSAFGRDADGKRKLVQVTEEERHTSSGGGSHILRVTSNPDLNGMLQPVQRETVETKRIDVDVEETKTTVMLPKINGGLAPALKSDEVRKRSANDAVESTKTTLLADGGGNWQVREIRQRTIRQDNNARSTEERVFRRNSEQDKLSEVSRVVSKASQSSSTEKRETVESYSIDVVGTTQDGNLHPVERATTAQRSSATGEQITDTQFEQPNPGDPDSDLRVSVLINGAVHPVPAGVQATQTISARDSNDRFQVVSVDTTKSDRVATIQFE